MSWLRYSLGSSANGNYDTSALDSLLRVFDWGICYATLLLMGAIIGNIAACCRSIYGLVISIIIQLIVIGFDIFIYTLFKPMFLENDEEFSGGEADDVVSDGQLDLRLIGSIIAGLIVLVHIFCELLGIGMVFLFYSQSENCELKAKAHCELSDQTRDQLVGLIDITKIPL